MRRALLLVGFLAAFTSGVAWAMSVQEVVRMLDAGIGEAVILEQIAAEGAQFRLTAEEILALKDAGASDDFLKALIRTGSAGGDGRANVRASQGEVSEDWTDRYASPLTRAEIYYDPFGYYWYPWPAAYAYYDPFGWLDCGFYYAGWWDHRWWRYGPYCDHYRGLYWHWDRPGHAIGPARDDRGRHVWSRTPRDDRRRTERDLDRGRARPQDRSFESPGRDRRHPTRTAVPAPGAGRGDGRTPGRTSDRRAGWRR